MNDADKALGFLRESGWTKKAMKNTEGNVCMAGAVRYGIYPVKTASGHKFISLADQEVMQEAAKVIEAEYPDRLWHETADAVGVVATFNDHDETIFSDVERVYEKVSARLDEKI